MQQTDLFGLTNIRFKQHGLLAGLCLVAILLPEVLMLGGIASTAAWAITLVWYPIAVPAVLYCLTLWAYGKHNLWMGIAVASWVLIMWLLIPIISAAATPLSPWFLLPQAPRMLSGGQGEWLLLAALILASAVARRFAVTRPYRPAGLVFIGSTAVALMVIVIAVVYSISIAPMKFSDDQLPTERELYDRIKDVYLIGARRPGTDAHKRATRHIFESLRVSGIDDVRKDSFEIDTWNARHWRLQVRAGDQTPLDIESFYTPWSKPTSSAGVDGPLVYVGAGKESDLEGLDLNGKVVLVDYFSADMLEAQLRSISYMGYEMGDPEAFNSHKIPTLWAYEGYLNFIERIKGRGVAAVIGVLNGYPDFGEFTYYAPYNGEYAPVTSLYIPEHEGERLKALILMGGADANVVLQADTVKDTADFVYAVLPGNSESSIIVHSHMDSPWASAVEDASGVGLVLGMADYYSQLPVQERSKTLIFLFTADHFGGGKATHEFIEKHQDGLLQHLVMDICIEHIALEYNPPEPVSNRVEPSLFFSSENPIIVSQLSQLIERYRLSRTFLLPTATPIGMPNDGHHFWLHGYNVVANISGPSWLFDKADTLDKVAVDRLVPATKLNIDLIAQLSRYPDFLLSIAPNYIFLIWYLFVINPLLFLFGSVSRYSSK